MTQRDQLGSVCPHCGKQGGQHLPACAVCHRSACDRCASMQVSHGERRTVHTECLRNDSEGFSMIRIVK